jgi:hypothetical protein
MFEGLLNPCTAAHSRGCAIGIRAQETAGVRQRNWRRNPRIQIGDEGTWRLS